MNNTKKVVLKAASVRFYSAYDEAAFFEWLNKIKCIKKYEGNGNILNISVDRNAIDETELRELLALFRRYGIAMQQLAVFDCQQFSEWFRNKQAYWYISVFE